VALTTGNLDHGIILLYVVPTNIDGSDDNEDDLLDVSAALTSTPSK